MLESAASVPERRSCKYARELGRLLIEKSDQVARRGLEGFGCFDLGRRRWRRVVIERPLRVHYTMVNFLHRFEMRVQLAQQFLARWRAAKLGDGHSSRQQIEFLRRRRHGVSLSVFGEL